MALEDPKKGLKVCIEGTGLVIEIIFRFQPIWVPKPCPATVTVTKPMHTFIQQLVLFFRQVSLQKEKKLLGFDVRNVWVKWNIGSKLRQVLSGLEELKKLFN